MPNKKLSFVVLALTREDIEYALSHVGVRPPAEISDWKMGKIAETVGNVLHELELWSIIAQVTEEVLSW